MTYTTTAKKDDIQKLFFPKSIDGDRFKVTVTEISEEEADDIEFRSLKGILGRTVTRDDVKNERLGI